MHNLGILRFEPVLKRIRWGGRRLGTVLGKPIGDESDYAESWEVSCHPNGPSIVSRGPHAGTPLPELVSEFPNELLGENRHATASVGRRTGETFPLLIKFLDAADRLSVQVHPDDEQAQQFEPGANGKTESWVILDAKPGSRLFVGLKPDVNAARLRAALDAGAVEDCLHSYEVNAGDCVFIPARTVHAIGEGILLAEIQQSSDITFRLYDWGRVGADGRPRELHIEEALACIDFDRGPVNPVSPRVISDNDPRSELLVESEYFTTRRHTSDTPFTLEAARSFRVLMMLDGTATVSTNDDKCELEKGASALVPACCGAVEVRPQGRGVTLLEATGP